MKFLQTFQSLKKQSIKASTARASFNSSKPSAASREKPLKTPSFIERAKTLWAGYRINRGISKLKSGQVDQGRKMLENQSKKSPQAMELVLEKLLGEASKTTNDPAFPARALSCVEKIVKEAGKEERKKYFSQKHPVSQKLNALFLRHDKRYPSIYDEAALEALKKITETNPIATKKAA